MFEQDLVGLALKEHYAKLADRYRAYRLDVPQLELLWEVYEKLAVALTFKCRWRDSAARCVRSEDRDRANQMVEIARENVRVLEALRDAWQTLCFSTNKPFGYEVIDLRVGGDHRPLQECR